jgi:hypothetical protein
MSDLPAKKGISLPHDAWWFALQVYLPLRVGLSALAAVVRALYPGDLAPDALYRPYLGLSPIEGGWRGLLLGVWQRWDTCWYMLIAREGYSLGDTRIFSPPLYPWLMRLTGNLLGGSDRAYLLGGLIVSNLACIAAFAYLYRLVEREWDVALARRSVVYLAIFPTAFTLVAAYAESLFLLCVIAALYHARNGRWAISGLWAFLAPLARLPGVVIVLPLAWEFGRQWYTSRRADHQGRTAHALRWWHGWPLLLAALGGLAYPLYARFVLGTDSVWAPFVVHTQRFAGRFGLPGQGLWHAARILASGQFRLIEPFDFFFALLFTGLTVAAFVQLPLAYALYMAATLAGLLAKTAHVQPLLSVSRYVLALFPGFMLLAKLGARSAWWHRAIAYPSFALLVFFAGQFVLWGWVG